MTAFSKWLGSLSISAWLIRLLLSLGATTVVAWGISFYVSDYVAKVHVTSMSSAVTNLQSSSNASAGALQSSLDRLNSSIQQNTIALQALQSEIALVSRDTGVINERVASLSSEIDEIKVAMRQTSKDINAISPWTWGDPKGWEVMRKTFGAEPGESVYIAVPSKVLP